MTTSRHSSVRDVTASQRTAGPGCAPTFTCAACHNPSPTTGRKSALVLGLRTYVCPRCHRSTERRKGPAPKPIRELIAAKVKAGVGTTRAGIVNRLDPSRREEAEIEIDRMVGDGALWQFERATKYGLPVVKFFVNEAEGQRWQSTPDGRAIPTFKPERQGTKLAPVHEQTKGLGWRTHKEPAPAKVQGPVQHTVQLMPAFDPRYQCDPKTRVIGGFASLGPGRYLDGAA